jgi:hypothetical protein
MLARLASAALLGLTVGPASAQWNGHLTLSTDQIQRGQTQSDRQGAASAALSYQHAGGLYASIEAASASREQFTGGAGYSLTPELGWRASWGPQDFWHAGVAWRSQRFPQARRR